MYCPPDPWNLVHCCIASHAKCTYRAQFRHTKTSEDSVQTKHTHTHKAPYRGKAMNAKILARRQSTRKALCEFQSATTKKDQQCRKSSQNLRTSALLYCIAS